MNKFNRIAILMLVCSSLIFILIGCSSSSEDATNNQSEDSDSEGGKVLKVGLDNSPGNIDPHFVTTNSEAEIGQPIFNGLFRYKPGTASFEDIEGDLAESWDVSKDGLTWTFQLHEGVQWHKDYGELTSKDVKYSIDRLMDPEVGSSSRMYFDYVESVEAPEKYTVVINLKQPYPSFPVSLVIGLIVKKEAIEMEGDAALRLVGTGPFELESYTAGESAMLKKNKDYFRGEPKLDKIEMIVMRDSTAREVAIENGDIHMTVGESEQIWIDRMRKKENLIVDLTGSPNVFNFHINSNMEPLDDILVRKAIFHAIDFESFRKSRGEDVSRPLTSVLDDTLYGHADIGQYEYNPELAKELLAEAGYPDGLTLPNTVVPNVFSFIPANSFIQEELRQVGIEAPMEQVDVPTWITTIYGDENPINFQGAVQRPHGTAILKGYFHSEGDSNFMNYGGSDELIEKAITEIDEEKSLELFKQAQQEIFDAYVTYPTFAGDQVTVRRKEVDLGYELKGTGVYAAPKYETTDLK